jgi:hypothetical protein
MFHDTVGVVFRQRNTELGEHALWSQLEGRTDLRQVNQNIPYALSPAPALPLGG